MSKCIRCGKCEAVKRICYSCLDKWEEMRKAIWDYHETNYGKLTPDNLKVRQKDTKRLERIWKKDKGEFLMEMDK